MDEQILVELSNMNYILNGIFYLLIIFFIYLVMRLIYRLFNWLIP